MTIIKVIQGHASVTDTEMNAYSAIILLMLGVTVVVLVAGPSMSVSANFYGKRGNSLDTLRFVAAIVTWFRPALRITTANFNS